MDQIKKDIAWLTVSNICALLDISQRCYYNALKNKPVFDPLSRVPPSQQLLTDQEENYILIEVAQRQIDKDCLSSQDIRNMAEAMCKSVLEWTNFSLVTGAEIFTKDILTALKK